MMGHSHSRDPANENAFSPEEICMLKKKYADVIGIDVKQLSNDSVCSLEKYLITSGKILSVQLSKHMYSLMKQYHPKKKNQVDLEAYMFIASKLIKGNAEEQARCLILLASSGPVRLTDISLIDSELLHQYCVDLIGSCMEICKTGNHLWNLDISEENISLLSSSSLQELLHPGLSSKDLFELQFHSKSCDLIIIEKWLAQSRLFNKIQECVYRNLFGLESINMSLLPACIVQEKAQHSILDASQVMFLNMYLPMELQENWKLLFSTKYHGENFSSMAGKILDVGPTLVIIQSAGGRVFGGFASQSWNYNGSFFGNSSCFLFSLKPRMGVYQSTGYNNHYQYINIQQQTLPNGLGFGGQLEYFGLSLDSNFGHGHSSKSCSTFNCPQLAEEDHFVVTHVEVWGLSQLEMNKKKKVKPKILDCDPGGKAILEIMGKHLASEGMREEDPVAGSPEEKELPPLGL